MPTPQQPSGPGSPPGPRFGVAIGMLNLDFAWRIEIQRAEGDGSGNADSSTAETIAVVPGWTRKYADERDQGSGPWFYRWRTVLQNCSNGSWSSWIGADPERIPPTLPDLPNIPPVIVTQWEADQTGDNTGKVSIEVLDFEQRITAIEFADKPGANTSFSTWKSSWDTSTGTKGTDRTLTRSESFTLHEKHNTIVKGRVQWDAPEGGTRTEILSPYTMDTDRTPELFDAMMRVGAGDGSVFVSVRGDGDVSTIYGRFAENTTVSDPDGTETDSTSGEINVSGQRLTDKDTGLDVSKGSTIHGKLRGENSSGTLGPVVDLRLDRFDFDDEAEVVSVSGAIDEPDGSVLVSASGDDDVDTIYITVAENSDPTDPDGTEDNVTAGEGKITTRTGTVDTDLQIDENSLAHIKARGENPDGTLGPVREARVERPPADVVTWELEASQSGNTGTATLRVEDPETRVTDLEFQKKTDKDGFGSWLSSWDDSTGATGTNTTLTRSEDLTLTEKHNVAIKVRITYTDRNGNARELIPSALSFDVDEIAELGNLELAIDDTDGSVIMSWGGDDDTTGVRWRDNIGPAPADPDGSVTDETATGRAGSVDVGDDLAFGESLYIKAAGEDSTGTVGPVREARIRRNEGDYGIVEIETDEIDDNADGDVDTGKLTATLRAAQASGNWEIEARTKQGRGSWSAWSDLDATMSTGDSVTEKVTLTEKVNSFIGWRVKDEDNAIVISGVEVFDQNTTPDIINMDATVNSSGNIEAAIKGDTDTNSVKIEYDFTGDGTVDETFTDSGASGSDTSTGTVSGGDTAIVTLTAYSQTGQSGVSTSDNVKVTRVSIGAALDNFVLTSVKDGGSGGDLTFDSSWSPNDAVDGTDNSLEIDYFDSDGNFAVNASISDPVSTTSDSTTATGAADGNTGERHEAQARLKNSSGNVIQTLTATTNDTQAPS